MVAHMLKPYHRHVLAACQRSPSLQNLCDFLGSSDPIVSQQCRIASLEVSPNSSFSCRDLDDQGLATLLQDPYPENSNFAGRILVVEDLSVDIIEMLGSSLQIDPSFFAVQLHNLRCEVSPKKPFSLTKVGQEDYIHGRYYHPFHCEKVPHVGKFCMKTAVRRKVVITATNNACIGWIQGRVSTLRRVKQGLSWLCKRTSRDPLMKAS
jgi:hypothetical protein